MIHKREEGFTLIELLIVIAILGTLAVVVLLALNPIQQLARTRDAGRFSTVTQLGHAVEAFATVNNGLYPEVTGASPGCAGSANWLKCLEDSGEISTTPGAVSGGSLCSVGVQNGWCYTVNGQNSSATVYTRLEALSNIKKCPSGQNAYAIYSTKAGRGGGWCGAGEPGVDITNFSF
jgi:prepilin-type N-terminal cleavage/methylation domain-containing protein